MNINVRCTKCGEKPNLMPRWTSQEYFYVGDCITCKDPHAEFVGDNPITYEGDDYADLS